MEYHAELQNAARSYRKCLAYIAYFGFRMRMEEGWTLLGFESGPRGEEAYRDSLEIPRSTWYKYVRIGQALHQLSLEDLQRIRPTNLELLDNVNPTLWHDFNWVAEAKRLEPKQLAELVSERNKTVGDDREPLTYVRFRVPYLAKEAVEQKVDDYRKRHGLSSFGQALEFIVADCDDTNLLTACYQAMQLIHGALASMQRKKTTGVEDERRWLEMAKEVLGDAHGKAVRSAREKRTRNAKSTETVEAAPEISGDEENWRA